ncbi:hypothetical protein C1645_769506 [Glomus cerebriforme]|uniref:Uncharacterized protein n=1 Tax=Glomus cerebriforme TaxID=658196 RepID=A0A397T138_9GLOM|nr:hypothetical protein C1645_769506 [Glomus cerebriforme]
MAQELLNNVSDDWKTLTKHIYFQRNTSPPSFSDNCLTLYSQTLEGELDLSQFPNLKRITFNNNFKGYVNKLESIDISENAELNKIVLNDNSNEYPLKTANCKFIIKERQLNQVVITYYEILYVYNSSYWIEKHKLLNKQKIMPYVLVEKGKKIEQFEAEIENLNKAIAEKDQQIESLKKEIEQTPTQSQFQELVDIVFSPNTDLDFDNLKNEIKRLKLKDCLPLFQKEKDAFTKLITNAKEKAGTNLEKFLELLLQIQKQIFEKQQENDSFAQGQLSAYQIFLQEKLDYDELQKILNDQKKLLELEKQLNFLESE